MYSLATALEDVRGNRVNRTVVGLFSGPSAAWAAKQLFQEAGYQEGQLTLLSSVDDDVPTLRQKPECIFRSAVRWAIIGALAVELPVVLGLFFLPVSAGVRIFMAASVWKAGGLIGAWLGVLLGQDHGLELEVAQRYERHLRQHRVVLAVRAQPRSLREARGMLLESGASEVHDVDGTVESKELALSAHP